MPTTRPGGKAAAPLYFHSSHTEHMVMRIESSFFFNNKENEAECYFIYFSSLAGWEKPFATGRHFDHHTSFLFQCCLCVSFVI